MVCWKHWPWAADKYRYQCCSPSTQSDHASAAWHMQQCRTQLIHQSMHESKKPAQLCGTTQQETKPMAGQILHCQVLPLTVISDAERSFPSHTSNNKNTATNQWSCRWKKNIQWGLGMYAWFLLALTIISHVTPVANPSGTYKAKYLLLVKMTVLKLAYMLRSGLQIAQRTGISV